MLILLLVTTLRQYMVHFCISFWNVRCSRKFRGGRQSGVREEIEEGTEKKRNHETVMSWTPEERNSVIH